MAKQSETYFAIVDLFFRLGQMSKAYDQFATQWDGMKYTRDPSGKTTHRVDQDIYISDTALWHHCTSAEWHLVGRITAELKEYNGLWHCTPELKNSSTIKKAIKGLIIKQILIKTETTNIYLVNPFHIRRGDIFGVLATTAKMLMDSSKVGLEHIKNKKPVPELNMSFDMLKLN